MRAIRLLLASTGPATVPSLFFDDCGGGAGSSSRAAISSEHEQAGHADLVLAGRESPAVHQGVAVGPRAGRASQEGAGTIFSARSATPAPEQGGRAKGAKLAAQSAASVVPQSIGYVQRGGLFSMRGSRRLFSDQLVAASVDGESHSRRVGRGGGLVDFRTRARLVSISPSSPFPGPMRPTLGQQAGRAHFSLGRSA